MSAGKVQFKKLLWVGPLSVAASLLGVLIIKVLAVAILQPNPAPPSLGWLFPTIYTVVLCTGAVFVFALVGRFAPRPNLTYQIIALVFLLISFIPDINFATSARRGTSWAVASALMSMPIVAGAVNVWALTRLGVAKE